MVKVQWSQGFHKCKIIRSSLELNMNNLKIFEFEFKKQDQFWAVKKSYISNICLTWKSKESIRWKFPLFGTFCQNVTWITNYHLNSNNNSSRVFPFPPYLLPYSYYKKNKTIILAARHACIRNEIIWKFSFLHFKIPAYFIVGQKVAVAFPLSIVFLRSGPRAFR